MGRKGFLVTCKQGSTIYYRHGKVITAIELQHAIAVEVNALELDQDNFLRWKTWSLRAGLVTIERGN
jgi:hypothetical protein